MNVLKQTKVKTSCNEVKVIMSETEPIVSVINNIMTSICISQFMYLRGKENFCSGNG